MDIEELNLPQHKPQHGSGQLSHAAESIKTDFVAAHGIFVTCREYNGFITPLHLNSRTWATRGEGDMHDGFKTKVASLMVMPQVLDSMGGLRMLRSSQQMLQDMGAVVIPECETNLQIWKTD